MTNVHNHENAPIDVTMATMLPAERWDPTRPPTTVEGNWGPVLEVSQSSLVRDIYANPGVSRQIMDPDSIGDPDVLVLNRGAWTQGKKLALQLISPIKEYYHRGAVDSLTGTIESETNAVIDRIIDEGSGTFEYVSTYGNIPYQVAARMLGMDRGEDRDLVRWLEVTATSEEGYRQQSVSNHQMEDRFLKLIAEHERTLGDGDPPRDPVDAYVIAKREGHEVGGQTIDNWWISGQLGMLVSATALTTKSQLGWNLMGFTEHGIWERLRENPGLTTGATRDAIRKYPAFPVAYGRASYDLKLGKGEQAIDVEAGTVLNGLITAANHDPAVYDQPERLDLLRTPNHHLTLAWDWRYCIGGPLVERILNGVELGVSRRFGQLALAGAPFQAEVGLVATVPAGALRFAYDPATVSKRSI